jgi:5-methylcytosine-specific restriction protein A
MTLRELTSREAVKSAIEECDRRGRDNFLQTYGFGPARRYLLLFNGRRYDSKAIVGVAYRYQFPKRGHLTADMFSGGITRDGAARRLRELGFEIDSL